LVTVISFKKREVVEKRAWSNAKRAREREMIIKKIYYAFRKTKITTKEA